MSGEKKLLVGVPSANGMGSIQSVSMLLGTGILLARTTRILEGRAGNIPRARNAVLANLGMAEGAGEHTLLWWDTDMLLLPGSERAIAEMVRFSEETHAAVTCNYRMATGGNVLMDGRGTERRHYSDDEIENMVPFTKVGMSGLGLCVMPIRTDYMFHADYEGEDIHFWYEHPELDLYYYPAPVKHGKFVWL